MNNPEPIRFKTDDQIQVITSVITYAEKGSIGVIIDDVSIEQRPYDYVIKITGITPFLVYSSEIELLNFNKYYKEILEL